MSRKSLTFHSRQQNVAVERFRWIGSIAFCLCVITSSWAQSFDAIGPRVQLNIQPTSIPPVGSLELQISRPVGSNADRYFVNVFMDINMDGQIGRMVESGLEEWIVRNYPVVLPEAEPTAVIPPPFHFGMGSAIPDLTEIQVSVSSSPITELDVAEGVDGLQGISADNLIELSTNQGQPLPIVMMKCPEQIDFSGEDQVDFSCTLINMNGIPTDAEYYLSQLTGGALVEGSTVIADEVTIGEPLLNDVEASLEASITIPFVATRTGELPSDWIYRARAADPTAAMSSSGVTINVEDSVGDLRFVDNLVEGTADESTLLLIENGNGAGSSETGTPLTTVPTLDKRLLSSSLLDTEGTKTGPLVNSKTGPLVEGSETIGPALGGAAGTVLGDPRIFIRYRFYTAKIKYKVHLKFRDRWVKAIKWWVERYNKQCPPEGYAQIAGVIDLKNVLNKKKAAKGEDEKKVKADPQYYKKINFAHKKAKKARLKGQANWVVSEDELQTFLKTNYTASKRTFHIGLFSRVYYSSSIIPGIHYTGTNQIAVDADGFNRSAWRHEMGHLFGLPDYYYQPDAKDKGPGGVMRKRVPTSGQPGGSYGDNKVWEKDWCQRIATHLEIPKGKK